MILIDTLTGDEACASFHCPKKESCSAVLTIEATLVKLQDLG
jgi:hypothetical protein